MDIKTITEHARSYFNLTPNMDDEQEIVKQITSGISFRGANLWVLIFAIFIASLGLNINSTAVIIGAMLISPLMGPIIGMGLAVGINDLDLLKRSAKNYGVATFVSVLTAMVYFLLTPLSEVQSELLARTSPTLYDVLIAFCGGAAGIIALCTRGKGNVIPGVAIATALMPPLCTAGFGLATGHLLYFLGAFYLFFINSVFIALATFCGVRLMHFHQYEFLTPERKSRSSKIVLGLALITMIPAALMTINIVGKSVFNNNVQRFVKTELSQNGTQIISTEADRDSLKLRVVAVGKEISEATQEKARKRMDVYKLGKYSLSVIQGAQSDSLILLNSQLSQVNTSREVDRQQLMELSAQVSQLSKLLEQYTYYEHLTTELRPELQALYPQIKTLSLSRVVEAQRDSIHLSEFVSAVISTDTRYRFTPTERKKLHDWLKARTLADSLVVTEK